MSQIRRRLAKFLAEEARQTSKLFLSDPDADLSAPLRRLDAARRLLDHSPQERRSFLVAVSIGVLCVFLASLAWTLRVPRTQIALHVRTQAGTLELAHAWKWSRSVVVAGDPIRLDGWNSIRAPMLAFGAESKHGDGWLEVEGGTLRLVSLELQPHTRLTISKGNSDEINVLVQGQALRADLALGGPAHVRVSRGPIESVDEHDFEARVPESLVLSSEGAGAVPAHLSVLQRSSWRLQDLRVTDLSFARQVPANPGAIAFESALLDGRVKVLATGEERSINAGERLVLHDTVGRVVEALISDEIEIRFEGSAKEILLGPEGFERPLSPTWLTYLYHNRPLSFFWSAVVFLWGLIWSTRRVLSGTA